MVSPPSPKRSSTPPPPNKRQRRSSPGGGTSATSNGNGNGTGTATQNLETATGGNNGQAVLEGPPTTTAAASAGGSISGSASGGSSSSLPAGGAPTAEAKRKKTTTTGVMDYVRSSLPRESLLELYSDEGRGRYVCRAVLQQLPGTSQQVAVRLVCTGGAFPLGMVQVWMATTTASRGDGGGGSGDGKISGRLVRQLEEMYRWAVLAEPPSALAANPAASVRLTDEFYRGLKGSMAAGSDPSPWLALTPQQVAAIEAEVNSRPGLVDDNDEGPVRYPPQTPDDLERHTQAQWDAVLHYMVGTEGQKLTPNGAVQGFLVETNLMQADPEYRTAYNSKGVARLAPLVITEKGYDFMLQDSTQQVWHFVVQYLTKLDAASGIQREVLLLLICLSFARFGECYSVASLNKDGRRIIRDLSYFGLLYVQGPLKKSRYQVFYPTRVAMQLVGADTGGGGVSKKAGGAGGGGGGMWSWSTKALDSALAHPRPHDSSHLAIIVQTNFQLCAYTTSELHVSMLSLFCDVQTIRRLPNVVMMSISRDSVKKAFNTGIKAEQMLRFLEKHAHPKLRQGEMAAAKSPLPANVVDQIFLWDRERHRVRWDDVFVHQPMMAGEYQAVHRHVTDLGACAWSSESRNVIMIKYSYVEKVQDFVQKWRARAAGGRP